MNELYHHGTKGQKHGVRRYQTTNGTWTPLGLARRRAREGDGDGDSNAKDIKSGKSGKAASAKSKKDNYFVRRKKIKAAKEEAERARKEREAKETLEERRARVLKSTDPQELYKNRHILTTAEINERMSRIDTEAKLGKLAASTKKTGMDYVDTFLKYGKKASEVYDFMQKPVGQALMVKMGLKAPQAAKTVNYERALQNINRLSNKEVQDLAARTVNEMRIRNFVNNQLRNSTSP